jgi:hypothetical protein
MRCLDLCGTVTQRETGLGLAGFVVAATATTGHAAKPLDFARTDDYGAFRLAAAVPLAPAARALRLDVLTADRRRTLLKKRQLSARAENVDIAIPGRRVGALA